MPKEGNSADEYEDAYSCSPADGHFAIADGATESSFADLWAQCLVHRYTAQPLDGAPTPTAAFETWLSPLQKEWHASINWERLPWYAEEKARTGAFATLLGVKFMAPKEEEKPSFFSKLFRGFSKPKPSSLRWRAIAVGDSNMFQIRNNTLLHKWPIELAAQFDSRPVLLSSNPKKNAPVWQEVKHLEGDYQHNDTFILATDALAKWFLQQFEAGNRPWNTLGAIKSEDEYASFITKLRKSSSLRNDDTTMVIFNWVDKPKE